LSEKEGTSRRAIDCTAKNKYMKLTDTMETDKITVKLIEINKAEGKLKRWQMNEPGHSGACR